MNKHHVDADATSPEPIEYLKIPTDPLKKKEMVLWLREHPVWHYPGTGIGCFTILVTISLSYVNPITSQIDDDRSRNTKPEVWIEAGPYADVSEYWPEDPYMPSHDVRLDCGADNLEDALCELASRVRHHYGDYKDR